MSLAELVELHRLVTRANGPEEIFESLRQSPRAAESPRTDKPLPAGEKLGPGEALEREYVKLTQLASPERYSGDPGAQGTARRILARLYELHQQALDSLGIFESVDSDDSRRAINPLKAEAEGAATTARLSISTGHGNYSAESLLAEGDLSRVYLGKHDGQSVVIKVAFSLGDNGLLSNEVQTLRLLSATDSPQRKHLPTLIDHFQTPDGRVGTVLGYITGYSFFALQRLHPLGVAGEHAVWMMSRLLSAIGFAHSQGVIHGHIEPAHILVLPSDHNVVLLDWSYSVIAPERTGERYKIYHPDYSAPEVAERKPPIPASDLYSLGKCMILLLGGEIETDSLPASVDERLARFVQSLVKKNPLERPQNAWQLHAQLKLLRQEIYGAHQFIKFEV